MTEFSRLLNKIIKNNKELKVYHIAKTINCDRTWFQKVMTGERKMNYETILPLCRFLKNYISESIVEELYESFAEEYFGVRRYQMILFIKDRMREMAEKEEYIHCLTKNRDFDIEHFVQEMRSDREELIRKIFSLVMQEKNRAKEQERSSRFYVHIPVKWAAVRDLFLFTLNNERNDEDIDFRCIFDENGYEEAEYKKRNLKMEAFLSACEYAIYQMNVYYVGDKETSFFQAALFPYYVISKSFVLLISGNGKMFVKIDEEERVKRFGEYFLEMMKGERFFWEEKEYGYEEMAETLGARKSYIFVGDFWKGVLSEKNSLKTERKKEEVYLQKEAAATVEDFYEGKEDKKICIITSPEGLKKVCRDRKRIEEELKNKEVYFLDIRRYRFHSRFYMRIISDRMIEFIHIKNRVLLGGGEAKDVFDFAGDCEKYERFFFVFDRVQYMYG